MRNKHNYLLAAVFFGFLLGSCSSSKNFHVAPDYNAEKVNAPVLVIPIWQTWFPNFPRHKFGLLNKTSKTTFKALLGLIFSQHTNSEIHTIASSAELNPTDFKIAQLGGDKYSLVVPTENLNFTDQTNVPKFVLILDQFYFILIRKQGSSSAIDIGIGTSSEGDTNINTLSFEIKYAYWDTEKKRVVGWGTAGAETNVIRDPSVADYVKLLSQTFEKIVKHGPLRYTGNS